jgi:hypothetical protein
MTLGWVDSWKGRLQAAFRIRKCSKKPNADMPVIDTMPVTEKKAETSTSKLSTSAPAFVPAYVDPLPPSKSSTLLRALAQPFVPTPKPSVPKSLLAEELDLDLDLPTGSRRAVQSASAPATEVVAIYARMADSLEKSCQKSEKAPKEPSAAAPRTEPRGSGRRGDRHRTAAANAATKRAALKPVPNASPTKKQRKEQIDSALLLEALPLTRSGVSNLLDELDIKPIASQDKYM